VNSNNKTTTVQDILTALFDFAPEEGKFGDDNVGLMAGDSGAVVTRVMCALDMTSEVIDEASSEGAQLIVVHHPLIYGSIAQVNDKTLTGKRIIKLLSSGIAGISMHTNLDAAPEGVNEALAEAVGLRRPFTPPDVDRGVYSEKAGRYAGVSHAVARAGYLDRPMTMEEFLQAAKKGLNCRGLRYFDSGRPVHYVCVIGGSGGSYLEAAIEHGCDTLLTGETRYSAFLTAREMGVNLVDADHFATENTVVPRLVRELKRVFPHLEIITSGTHNQTAQFYI